MSDPTQATTLSTDNSFLPAAVRAQINRANAMMAATSEPAPGDAPPELTPEPVTQQVIEPAPEPVPEPAPAPEEGNWEQRYKAMKGRFDKADNQVKVLTDEVSNLRRIIARLEAQAAQVQVPSVRAPDLEVEELTDEERNDYGPDMIRVMEKTAAKVAAQVASKYEAEIADLKRNVGAVRAETEVSNQSKFEQDLAKAVPDWLELNQDQGFLAWLGGVDTFSGQPRRDLLLAAYNRWDAPRVAAFFTAYKQATGALQQDQSGTQPGKVSLETLAAPGRAKSTTVKPTLDDKPNFTRAQIRKFYDDRAQGRYRGHEADADRIEQQIFAATTEGRVR